MIEKMQKYSFLVYHKEYDRFVEDLYNIGVVDVINKEINSVVNEKLDDKISLIKQYAAATSFLNKKSKLQLPDNVNIDYVPSEDSILTAYKKLREKEEAVNQSINQIKRDKEALLPWGNFSFETIENIHKAGYTINFFLCSKKSFNEKWKNTFNAMIVSESTTSIYFITVTPNDTIVDVDADIVKLPDMPLEKVIQEEQRLNNELETIAYQYIILAKNYLPKLKEEAEKIRTDFDFSKVKLNTEEIADNQVKLVEGWVPVVKIEELDNYLKDNGILYTSREPDVKQDNVPILLKNNSFFKLFEPLGELYTLPKYGELDLTPFFAPFYMLFFGLCLGDCGYGLVLAIAAFILAKKAAPSMKGIFKLAGWLGVSTVLMGTVSGTFFGINLIEAEWPWLENFKRIMLDSDQLFTNSLILGVIQIIFGMIVKIVNMFRQKEYSSGIVTIGWLLIILGCGGTFGLQHLDIVTPSISKVMYIGFGIAGGICVFLLNNLNFGKKNLFGILNIGSGLWDAYNMVTGLLGDVLSYIRLFALGISGSVMGFVFNSLAMDISPDIIIVKQIVMLVILLIGHAMNIFMSALSAFVHPMRLTFVEFYKNSGFTGGGKKYNPFGKIKVTE